MRSRLPILFVLLIVPLAIGAGPRAEWPPQTLRDTGLYADWSRKTVNADAMPFSPQYPLWSDGAGKARWVQLPRGAWIDAADPDVWKFPVGTRFWKEFTFQQRKVETRFIELTSGGWQYATYEWAQDEGEATLVGERGSLSRAVVRGTLQHIIPSRTDCRSCHEGSPSRILGFSALQLSADRDPNAPHAEPLPAGAVTLRTLVERGLVRGLPRHLTDGAPRIAAATPTARAAIGYLHGNCGNCHTAAGELANLAFSLHYPVGEPPSRHAPVLLTSVGRQSTFVPSTWEAPVERVRVGDPDRSVLAARVASRNPVAQMPPVGSRIVDNVALALIRKWIADDPAIKSLADTPKEEK